MRALALLLLGVLMHAGGQGLRAAEAPPTLHRTIVFQSGEAGYHTYRIPSLLVTRSGALLALAEARKHGAGDAGDIDLVVKRSTDGGRS